MIYHHISVLNKLIFIAVCFFSAAVTTADQAIIAQWDFSSKDVLSGTYPLILRNKTKVDNGSLLAMNSTITTPGGAMVKKVLPQLTPENAFRIDAQIVLENDPGRSKNWAMIYDAKYVSMPKGEKQSKLYNRSFMFFFAAARQKR